MALSLLLSFKLSKVENVVVKYSAVETQWNYARGRLYYGARGQKRGKALKLNSIYEAKLQDEVTG
jgi:hypothetical protein